MSQAPTVTSRHATAAGPLPAHARVVVVGGGFSGIGTVVALKRAGIDEVVVLERADSLGGTWRDNTYPGAACDVPSHLYSFSFAPKRDWSHVYSRQAEIREYLEQVAADHGVLPHLYCSTDVVSGQWDDDALLWRLETSRGSLTADVVVSGAGGLVEPHLPDVPGVETFRGPSFHSARWDHSVDLAGRRVAVVGTGASAAQFVPELQATAAEVVVFQRTPPWVIARADRAYSDREHRLHAGVPGFLRLARGLQYWSREARLRAFIGGGRLRGLFEKQALRFLEQEVPDPRLRAALTPDYAIGCKRVIVSDDYLRALTRPNVRVVASPVTEVRPHAVVAADGTEHEVDVVVYGTGFRVMDIPLAHRLTGREGRTLHEEWARSGVQAHRGTTVAGFPNLFLLLGPNTVLGHNSVVIMIEAQIGYVVAALQAVREAGADALEVRRSAQEAYNARLQAELTGTVWNAGGCRSWYRDAQGRNFTLWPTHTLPFVRLMRRFDAESYELRAARRVPVHA
ncbi:Predicted flavoprotein CzcO associated with the cation diffusion facilitator CzcD [Geodermatophilus saharensis]|uniref:Predicted flavoprotein CzcO associated with the cation diffusion facilitator CzcD n=1 Tax=Geodermatophilus saharensis TaxID=1137994 RepID=A0A239F479_9ACTN|nr:NAD(P)/FAD-dependent oxidoreductase [Geodermatophilus saharensis]SNS50914.1 Predicted flavoprotein CzcO associated with the cation diffusion facilitator CzcD [Geodermatophilus saharensis]